MNEFYIEIHQKQRKLANMHLQTDNQFHHTKIKDLK